MTIRTRAVAALALCGAVVASVCAATPAAAASKPTITAHVKSAAPRTQYGWYRKPVTITFTCKANGSPLATACPKPVTLTTSAKGQSVTRSIKAKDGGRASVTVKDINIDMVAPTARVLGVVPNGRYFNNGPNVRCSASDALSGLVRCQPLVGIGYRQAIVTSSVMAVDRAGNSRTASVRWFYDLAFLDEADYDQNTGDYVVKAGHTYTLDVTSTLHPRYVDAAVYPQKPTKRDLYLQKAKPDTWKLKITIDKAMRSHKYWNLGVEIGGRVDTFRVRVTS